MFSQRSLSAADIMAWKALIPLMLIPLLPVYHALDELHKKIDRQGMNPNNLNGDWNSGKG